MHGAIKGSNNKYSRECDKINISKRLTNIQWYELIVIVVESSKKKSNWYSSDDANSLANLKFS